MRDRRDFVLDTCIFMGIVAVIAFGIHLGAKSVQREEAACLARGGHVVKKTTFRLCIGQRGEILE